MNSRDRAHGITTDAVTGMFASTSQSGFIGTYQDHEITQDVQGIGIPTLQNEGMKTGSRRKDSPYGLSKTYFRWDKRMTGEKRAHIRLEVRMD